MARKFFYDTGEEKVGPVTGNDLVRLRAEGAISDATWVRAADSETWRPLAGVNLQEEEEEERNPSLWRLLTRNLGVGRLLMIIAVGIVFVVLLAGVVSVLWPVLLVIPLLWILSRALR
ncbi:MAG: hypothetical protein Q4C88_08950 [Akkermansia sp.]|nr:hypothetical protein [Akkermansia sp.]